MSSDSCLVLTPLLEGDKAMNAKQRERKDCDTEPNASQTNEFRPMQQVVNPRSAFQRKGTMSVMKTERLYPGDNSILISSKERPDAANDMPAEAPERRKLNPSLQPAPAESTCAIHHDDSASDRGEDLRKPQHESDEDDDEFEIALIIRRDRRVLLSRLQESLPNGRLSFVR
jgi:hypothetical protein